MLSYAYPRKRTTKIKTQALFMRMKTLQVFARSENPLKYFHLRCKNQQRRAPSVLQGFKEHSPGRKNTRLEVIVSPAVNASIIF